MRLRARVRADVHGFLQALARGDYPEALLHLKANADPEDPWTPERLEAQLAPFLVAYDRVVFDHRARNARFTRMEAQGPNRWRIIQVLCDPEEDDMWFVEGDVELGPEPDPAGPLMRLERSSN